ncbi:ribosomal protein L7/L12 [Alcanivorax sp.]|uniref:ribosomal protein L7/L12 n=1 Tax=Alcanivorax sp. TaxID=1872427 RepID=UPI0025C045D8|nr:ribosomal protein L7/L12 [Alcanivorax sp.]
MRLPESIEQILIHNGKIAAIKALREVKGLGLREAKEWVESHEADNPHGAAQSTEALTGASSHARPSPAHQVSGLPIGRILLGVIVVGAACLGYALANGML